MPTHGSLTKAGKMREQTGKPHFRQETITTIGKEGVKHTEIKKYQHSKKHKSPRLSGRRKYEKRILMKMQSGQNYPGE